MKHVCGVAAVMEVELNFHFGVSYICVLILLLLHQLWSPIGSYSSPALKSVLGEIHQNCTVNNIFHLWPQISTMHQKTEVNQMHPISLCCLLRQNLHNLSSYHQCLHAVFNLLFI